ncbi:hypothetical protein VPH35_104151 [Triticum aestivum]
MAARGQGLEQDFDFFVVVDFEATCVKDGRIFPQEIVEFPAVLVDGATGRIESAFRRYVRPKHHPVLIKFCRELTGIRQEDVDGGVELGDVLWLHDSWLKAVTAGAGNKRGAALGGGGRVNLQEAVRAAGLDWEGRLHCGLDDALNTARLLAEIMRRGVKITITGSLAPPPPIQQKQQPGASPCGGSPALAPPPIQQQPPRTGPCSGTFALVPAPAPIQQKQQPPQPHIISPCGGSSACFSYCEVATRGAMEPGPMRSGCANWTPAMGPYFLWSN